MYDVDTHCMECSPYFPVYISVAQEQMFIPCVVEVGPRVYVDGIILFS